MEDVLVPVKDWSEEDEQMEREMIEELGKKSNSVPLLTRSVPLEENDNNDSGSEESKEDKPIQCSVDEVTNKQPLRPAQAQVYSKRSKRSGATMMQIGEASAAQKNLEDLGNPNPNSFSILQDVDNNILDNVALNCGVILGEEVNSKMDVICLLKAKELAQAAIEQAKLSKKRRDELAEVSNLNGRELGDNLQEEIVGTMVVNNISERTTADASPPKRGERRKKVKVKL